MQVQSKYKSENLEQEISGFGVLRGVNRKSLNQGLFHEQLGVSCVVTYWIFCLPSPKLGLCRDAVQFMWFNLTASTR